MKIQSRLATPEDAEEILKMELCAADLEEIVAGSGKAPDVVLVESIEATPEVMVVLLKGRIVAIYGVAPSPVVGVGVPWFLSTGELDGHSKTFLKESQRIIKSFQEQFEALFVVSDSRHTASKLWLMRLGFSLLPDTRTFRDPTVPFNQFVRFSNV